MEKFAKSPVQRFRSSAVRWFDGLHNPSRYWAQPSARVLLHPSHLPPETHQRQEKSNLFIVDSRNHHHHTFATRTANFTSLSPHVFIPRFEEQRGANHRPRRPPARVLSNSSIGYSPYLSLAPHVGGKALCNAPHFFCPPPLWLERCQG